MKVDWLVVGAGLTGATFAERMANVRGETVLIVDQRDHIGGNVWDEFNEHGVLVHRYGPHIFHTNSKWVWDYLSQFTHWRPYFHKVLGSIDGKLVPLPFNLNSIEQLFTPDMAQRLSNKLIEAYGFGSRVPILKLREAEDTDLRFIADYVYKNIFETYTIKQWGLRPEELCPSVTARVPILVSRDDRYFQDTYQAMPSLGYGAMVRRMLAHKNIRIMLNTRWQDIEGQVSFNKMVFTGPIDEFFEYKHGQLPYRSLRFEMQTHPTESYQSAAVVNYPNEYDYTRITEQKWLTGQSSSHTTTLAEYPLAHVNGETVPYYPIPTDKNREQFKLYKAEASKLTDKVIFAGRLADYIYYNMDQAVASALKKCRSISHE
jgi:UDP-galactopyranose mutase